MQDDDSYTPNDLIIEALDRGRDLTDRELDTITEHVALAGFDDMVLERARGRLDGIVWDGRILRGSDMIRPSEAHFLRHAVYRSEWPTGTDLAGFLQSLRELILDARSGLAVCRYQGAEQLTIIRRSLDLQGPAGFPWVLVDYRVATGHWVTTFQPDHGLAVLQSSDRSDLRWLRRPQ